MKSTWIRSYWSLS